MDITDDEIENILARWKSILADNRKTWVKSHMDNFDAPMGDYYSVQVADLIGIYILDTLGRIVNLEQVGFPGMTESSSSRVITTPRSL